MAEKRFARVVRFFALCGAVAMYAIPVQGVAQDSALAGLVGQSVSMPEIARQFSDDKQFVDSALLEVRQAILVLSVLDEGTLAPQYHQTHSGIAERMAAYSQVQSEFIEDYADMMALRTETFFDLWKTKNDERVGDFFLTGSLYGAPALDPALPAPELPGEVIGIPEDAFPGIVAPDGGFFAQIDD